MCLILLIPKILQDLGILEGQNSKGVEHFEPCRIFRINGGDIMLHNIEQKYVFALVIKFLQEEHSNTWFDRPNDIIRVGFPKLGSPAGKKCTQRSLVFLLGVLQNFFLGSSHIARSWGSLTWTC